MVFKVSKRIKDIIDRDKKVMITTTREPYPFVVERGDGDFAYDIDGNKFIDFTSFIGVYNMGVNTNRQIREAIKAQVDRLSHSAFLDFHGEPPVAFAEKLLTMFPKGFGKVFFSNSGTEANEAALKLSRIFKQKRLYNIAFYGAFHGRTMGSLSLTAAKVAQKWHFGPYNNTIHVPFAYCYRCPLKLEYPSCGVACADYIVEQPLSHEVAPQEVATIFMEPVQGEGGYIVPPKEFVQKVRKIASEHGIVFVADEVQSGYMRTGKFLALDNFGVEADVYTMAKALGGGVPIGATITRTSLGDIPPGAHANTFGGNFLAIAAANASLDYVKKNQKQLESNARAMGALIMKRLNEMKEKYEIVGDVRGIGLMIGVEFVKSKKTKEFGAEEREAVVKKSFDKGLLLLGCGPSSIRLIPPVTVSKESVTKGMDAFEQAVKEVNGKR